MLKKHFICVFFIFQVFVLFAQTIYIENAELLSKKQLSLNKFWTFYPGVFVDPEKISEKNGTLVQIPHKWNDYAADGLFSGSYRQKLTGLKPLTRYGIFVFDRFGTSAAIYINGSLVRTIGKPDRNPLKTVPEQDMMPLIFDSSASGEADFLIHISNGFHRKGGLWGNISIAEEKVIMRWYNSELNQRFLFAGSLLIIILYHLSLFFLRRDDRTNLYLALFSATILLRLLVQGFSLIAIYFPFIPYVFRLRLEYTVLFAAPIFFTLYLGSLYKKKSRYIIHAVIVVVGVAFGLLTYVLPETVVTRIVIPGEVYMMLSALYLLVTMIYEGQKASKVSAMLNNIGLLFMTLTMVNDIFMFNFLPALSSSKNLTPYSFIVFVIAQSIITAWEREKMLANIRALTENLMETNKVYLRFVPHEILDLLGKKNIVDIRVGQSVDKKVALLCADLRNFTSISEQLTPKEVFDLLNEYLSIIGPIIRKHNGFIEKYMGDGLIAIFPESPQAAFDCAVDLQKTMVDFRKKLVREKKPLIHMGIGIHFGDVILGTVGSSSRMNSVLISKTVETVMNLESLTKHYKVPVIASKIACQQIQDKTEYRGVKLDNALAAAAFNIKEDIYAIKTIE